MGTVRIVLLFTSFLFFSSNCWSQGAALPSPTKRSEANLLPRNVLAYFKGTWSGQGHLSNGKMIASDISFVDDLQSQCLVVKETEKPPNTFKFVALWSMDSVSGKPVMLLASNHDSGARLFRSQGWQDGKIVFQSGPELRASWALERFTFERKSNTVFEATYEFSSDDGRTWQVGDRQVYTKVSSL